MKNLFAPWRMVFIEDANKCKSSCVLCEIGEATVGPEFLVIHRGIFCYLVMNKFPYGHAHLMVVPFRHEKDWTKLGRDELLELNELTQKALQALAVAFQPEGFNIGVNLGRTAGAGIESHVHQHIVPRWVGDYNFMPLFSEVRVVSEHLEQTYQRILKAWETL